MVETDDIDDEDLEREEQGDPDALPFIAATDPALIPPDEGDAGPAQAQP